jgi:hypothetical protein
VKLVFGILAAVATFAIVAYFTPSFAAYLASETALSASSLSTSVLVMMGSAATMMAINDYRSGSVHHPVAYVGEVISSAVTMFAFGGLMKLSTWAAKGITANKVFAFKGTLGKTVEGLALGVGSDAGYLLNAYVFLRIDEYRDNNYGLGDAFKNGLAWGIMPRIGNTEVSISQQLNYFAKDFGVGMTAQSISAIITDGATGELDMVKIAETGLIYATFSFIFKTRPMSGKTEGLGFDSSGFDHTDVNVERGVRILRGEESGSPIEYQMQSGSYSIGSLKFHDISDTSLESLGYVQTPHGSIAQLSGEGFEIVAIQTDQVSTAFYTGELPEGSMPEQLIAEIDLWLRQRVQVTAEEFPLEICTSLEQSLRWYESLAQRSQGNSAANAFANYLIQRDMLVPTPRMIAG